MAGPPGGLPPKKNKLSNKPLKPLQWTKVNNIEIANTIWKQLDDAPVHKKMDYNEFEDLFGAFQKKEKELDEKSMSRANLSSLASSDNLNAEQPKISVFDAKRSQNINILIKSMKISAEDIKRAIYDIDLKILTPHVITELMKLVPSQDEIQMLQSFENDAHNFAAPEKFVWELTRISRYSERVKALNTKAMFDEWCEDAKKNIKAWAIGCKEVNTSKKFKDLLQIVLALGNYLNTGQRGGAYGFKLESLLKVAEVRSTVDNRRYTLLHYLVELLEKKFPDIKDWREDMKSMEIASKVELPALRANLQSIKVGLKDAQALMDAIAADPRDPTDQFANIMTDWIKGSQKKYEQLDQAFKDAENAYTEVCKSFGEDPKALQPNEFFLKFHMFINQFNQAQTDNEQFIQKQLDAEKKEKEKQERAKILQNKKGKLASIPSKTEGSPDAEGADGQLDELIDNLKTGKAFFNQGFAPQKREKGKKTPTLKPTDLNKNLDLVAKAAEKAQTPIKPPSRTTSAQNETPPQVPSRGSSATKPEDTKPEKRSSRLSFLRKPSLSQPLIDKSQNLNQ